MFYCVWGFLALWFYLFIVVSFNQEHQYHTSIPVSIHVIVVGLSISCDMYVESLELLIMVLWKLHLMQCCVQL